MLIIFSSLLFIWLLFHLKISVCVCVFSGRTRSSWWICTVRAVMISSSRLVNWRRNGWSSLRWRCKSHHILSFFLKFVSCILTCDVCVGRTSVQRTTQLTVMTSRCTALMKLRHVKPVRCSSGEHTVVLFTKWFMCECERKTFQIHYSSECSKHFINNIRITVLYQCFKKVYQWHNVYKMHFYWTLRELSQTSVIVLRLKDCSESCCFHNYEPGWFEKSIDMFIFCCFIWMMKWNWIVCVVFRGIFFQGYRCTRCKMAAHKECLGRVPACGRNSGERKLRREWELSV